MNYIWNSTMSTFHYKNAKIVGCNYLLFASWKFVAGNYLNLYAIKNVKWASFLPV